MISTPTLFILGAGASQPYKFPLGKTLLNNIVGDCKGRVFVSRFLFNEGHNEDFGQKLLYSGQKSVDAFLEYRPDYVDIGKIAIAYRLLAAEAQHDYYADDWYEWLIHRMTDRVPFDQISRNKVNFISFNYDRSLEYRLHLALCAKYKRSDYEVAEVMKSFEFIHVHGTLGYLPWQTSEKEKIVAYGDESEDAVRKAGSAIKIISDATIDNSAEFRNARRVLQLPNQRVAVLGLGYHPVNMDRLGLNQHNVMLFGTCYGMTKAETDQLVSTYQRLRLQNNEWTAIQFLRGVSAFQPD